VCEKGIVGPSPSEKSYGTEAEAGDAQCASSMEADKAWRLCSRAKPEPLLTHALTLEVVPMIYYMAYGKRA